MRLFILGAILLFGGLSYIIVSEDSSKRLTCAEAVAVIMVYSGSVVIAVATISWLLSLL